MLTVELALKMVVAAERMSTMLCVTKHITRLLRESTDGNPRRDLTPMRYLACDVAHRAACDRGYRFQQMPGGRIAVQGLRDLPDVSSEVRRGLGDSTRDFRKRFLHHGRHRPSDHWKQLAGGHSYQRQEMLCRLVFRFRFRG
jgi:hypothetical protein